MLAFALKTLFYDRLKLLIAVVGVVFSLVLVNIQGGLFLGMIGKASVIVDNGAADIWIGHRGVKNSDIAPQIPEAWINRVRGLAGVIRAEPLIVAESMMMLPNGEAEQVLIIGSDRASMLGSARTFESGGLQDLLQPNSISIDDLDRPRLGHTEVGDVVELSGKRAKVVAKTRGILGFITTPYVFTTYEAAREYTGMREGYCSFYLVEADEGVKLDELCKHIRRRVPELDAYTAKDFSTQARIYWMIRTGIGMSFGGSTLLGLTVGLLMVAQSLYAFVLDHLTDYATLKALGAEERHIHRVLIAQGMTIAAIGIAVGTVISRVIQSSFSTPLMPIVVPMWLFTAGVCVTVMICLISSILPFGRIRRVDPVTVLQD